MKSIKYIAAICCAISLGFASCGDDDDELPAKPSITLTEVGHDNSRHAHPGHDLHVEADVLADGLTKDIKVKIQMEGGDYAIIHSYTDSKYIGVKNAEFHEHIDIPEDAPLGSYKLLLTVTDSYDQQATAESQLTINNDDDDEDEHDHE